MCRQLGFDLLDACHQLAAAFHERAADVGQLEAPTDLAEQLDADLALKLCQLLRHREGSSGTAFAALKLAGAVYLVVLGLRALRAAVRGERLVDDLEQRPEPSTAAAFRRGLASDLLNVKVGLFWTALVPQFVTAGSPVLLPAAMVAGMGALVFGWLVAYAQLAGRRARTLNRRGSSIALNGAVGTVLVAFGARLGLAHP